LNSGAILYRIAETSEVLMPADPGGRSDTLAWMFAALQYVEPPLINLLVMSLLRKDEEWAKLGCPVAVEAVKTRFDALCEMARWARLSAWPLHGGGYLMTTCCGLFGTPIWCRISRTRRLCQTLRVASGVPKVLRDQMDGYAAHTGCSLTARARRFHRFSSLG